MEQKHRFGWKERTDGWIEGKEKKNSPCLALCLGSKNMERKSEQGKTQLRKAPLHLCKISNLMASGARNHMKYLEELSGLQLRLQN